MDKNEIIKRLYYNAEEGLQSAQKLYQKLKDKGIKLKDITAFLKQQEIYQLHYKPTHSITYYPIISKYKDHIWQCDLMDLSDISSSNYNVKYILCCIDIFTRYAFVVPLKNKTATTMVDAFETVLKSRKPEILCSDNGSEFTNAKVKQLLTNNNIEVNYFQAGDKHKMGLIERFNKTIRGLINKYLTAYNTTRYIDVLDKLVKNYNNSFHSGIQSTPSHPDVNKIKDIIVERQTKAMLNEVKFNIGDQVRYVINKTTFEKGSNPRWSKIIHKVTEILNHSYVLDNNKSYKYYELQPINIVQKIDKEPIITKTRTELKKENKRNRTLVREGIIEKNIITHPRQTMRSKRINPDVILPAKH